MYLQISWLRLILKKVRTEISSLIIITLSLRLLACTCVLTISIRFNHTNMLVNFTSMLCHSKNLDRERERKAIVHALTHTFVAHHSIAATWLAYFSG